MNLCSDSELLFYFQLRDIFNGAELDEKLNEGILDSGYPELVQVWSASDPLSCGRVLFPKGAIDVIAQRCAAVGDFFAGPDGEILYISAHGKMPLRFSVDCYGKMRFDNVVGARKLTVLQAINEYGADAVWLACEYGESRRGQREDKFRIMIGCDSPK